tara:strand:- start:132 stop:539 length:408 start_codon:yes stop_codon:yes gene_type:complete
MGGRIMRKEKHKFIIRELESMLTVMKDRWENKETIRMNVVSEYDNLKDLVNGLPDDFIGVDWMRENIRTQKSLIDDMERVSKEHLKWIEKCEEAAQRIVYSIDLHSQGVLSEAELNDVISMEGEVLMSSIPEEGV